jgi:hypothetical protein
MKNSLSFMVTTLSLSALLTSCNPQVLSSDSTVSTGFSVTGSGQNAVAKSDLQKFFSLFLPSAYALTPPPLLDANGASLSLDEAWIVVKKIEFHTRESELRDQNQSYGSDNIKLRGPHFINLLSDEPEVLANASLPPEGIRRLKMELHKSDTIPQGAPEGLSGNSIYFSGLVNGIPFSFSSADNSEFKIRGPKAVVPEASKKMMAVIRIAGLFSQIDLSVITSPTDISKMNRVSAVNPCPQIDPNAQDLYRCFRKGLEAQARFGRDNGDKDLDQHDECVNNNGNIPVENSVDDSDT